MAGFHTTRWSLLLAAREPGDAASAALAELCGVYREAVLAYVRYFGHHGAEAEDLTQGFFLKFLEQRYDAGADPQRGRFRSYLLAALKGYLANAWDAAHASKRGGGVILEELETADARAPLLDAAPSPERAFERAWAWALVARALTRLRAQAQAAGRGDLYAALGIYVVDPPDAGAYRELAARLGMPANTIAVSVRRWREQLQQLIREELAQTLDDPKRVDAELAALRAALV